MNKEKNFLVKKDEAYYSTVLFMVENYILMVKHWKGSVYKIFGGTYSGSEEQWIKRGEGKDHYDNFSEMSISRKIRLTLKKVFKKNLDDGILSIKTIDDLTNLLTNKFGNEPEKIQALIEMIEETGLIPVDLKPFHRQVRGIQQFFFICEEAFAFSRDRKSFIPVNLLADLPLEGQDYSCSDEDIESVNLVHISDVQNYEKYNFAYSHRDVLKSFSMKKFVEKDK